MRVYSVLICIFFSLSLFFISCGKDDPAPKVEPENKDVNTWIYKVMEEDYLWYKDLPAKASLDFSKDPEEFFKGLRSEKDGVMYGKNHLYFSTIEKKATATKSISENEPTYGFEFMLYNSTIPNTLWGEVLYVLSGSPAEEAGLKRGDWIISMGASEESITLDNYSALETGDGIQLNLARLEKNVLYKNGSCQLKASVTMNNNPFIKDTILSLGGKTIGYLAYTHFSSGPNNNADKSYDNQMKEIFTNFKAKQVNEFVLDLRYNGGGLVSSAKLLASLLAPASALGNIFGYLEYNDKNTADNSTLRFETASSVSSCNLNLSRLYVLTGDWTASASEAVINMLLPDDYMGRQHITLIGNKTIGKTVGSNTYGEKEKYDWLLHPIVLRIYNKDRKADYEGGFQPDIALDESSSDQGLAPLGSPEELLLAEALKQMGVSGLKSTTQTGSPFGKRVYSSLDRRGIKGFILDSAN